MADKIRKPIIKRWWFWVIIGIIFISAFNSNGNKTKDKTNSAQPTVAQVDNTSENITQTPTPTPTVTETPKPSQSTPTPTPTPKQSIQTNTQDKSNIIVYYVPGSKVYHLSKDDPTLRNSKTILSMTLEEAEKAGMHKTASKADQ